LPVYLESFIELIVEITLSIQEKPMSNKHGLQVKKPVSVWNQPLKTNFKELFKSLSKAVAQTTLKNWGLAITSAVDAVSAIELKDDAEGTAWLLIYRSLIRAMYALTEENLDLLQNSSQGWWNLREQPELSEEDLAILFQKLDFTLEESELTIDETFFNRPRELSVVENIKKPFSQWLIGNGLSEAQAKAISDRLPAYFVYALSEEWREHRNDYVIITTALDTPFTKASEREQAWMRYAAWLQKQIEEPMFNEAFSLKKVYIKLRAYYERKKDDDKSRSLEKDIDGEKQREKIVFELEKHLDEWVDTNETSDALRIISGGPGCGKSSFAKMFAAKQSEKTDRRVLFIPLHRFELKDDLIDAVKALVSSEEFLPHNPIDPKEGDSRLLIIFDGLDELSMQGKVGAEVAQQFVQEVLRKLESLNNREPKLKVLISGRELSVQANENSVRKLNQILHILPYYSSEESQKEYIDAEKLLEQDQRQLWWASYGEASGRGYTNMPAVLGREELVDITTQPLLNYLVALSYDRGEVNFNKETNINVIYEDLLKSVHQRVWAEHQHPAIKDVPEEMFFRILEEIAVATWHGDGRTTSIKEIERHCDSSGIRPLLERFKEGAEKGVARLLMAFYFRKSGMQSTGDETFEFTHKSFGEYLTAKRIVRGISRMHNETQRYLEAYESGWQDKEALTEWIKLCGATAIDDYIFKFLRNEVQLQKQSTVEKWQNTLCRLISFMLKQGTPMEKLEPRPSFKEEVIQARNTEEASLVALNVCALCTKKSSEITWHSPIAFGEMISRLQGQSQGGENVLAFRCFGYLKLSDSILHFKDLFQANLQYTDLQNANLYGAYLYGANLQKANLQNAKLQKANLQNADLQNADLQNADLLGAILQGADLKDSVLKEAIWVDGRKIKGGVIGNLIFEEEESPEE
jgi:DNA replication protein DnaC